MSRRVTNLQPIRTSSPSVLSQETLRLLRDLRQKRRELRMLEAKVAGEVLEAIQGGWVTEPGPLRARLRSEESPAGRLIKVLVR